MLTVLRADKGWEPFTRAIERPDAAGITTLRRLGVIAP